MLLKFSQINVENRSLPTTPDEEAAFKLRFYNKAARRETVQRSVLHYSSMTYMDASSAEHHAALHFIMLT